MQFLALILSCLALSAHAGRTLSDLQPIADFSDACTEAYSTSIQNCNGVYFAPFGGFSTCTRPCWEELNNLVSTIQSGCQSDGVKPDTVIAHAFQGDLADWMCARGVFATVTPTVASGTATNAKATTASTSSSASSSASSSTEETTTTRSSSTSSSSDSSSTASSTSATRSTTLTTSTTSSTTNRHTNAAATQNVGDSTPFDQGVLMNKSPSVKEKASSLVAIVVVPICVASLIIGLGSWNY